MKNKDGPLLKIKDTEITSLDGEHLFKIEDSTFDSGVTALSGANGSGKSTLLKVLSALHPARYSNITFGSFDVRKASYQKQLTYMPQNFSAYPELSGNEFLVYLLRLNGCSKKQAISIASYWMTLLGLESSAHKRTETYSQGMLQKLGFAFAVSLNRPLCLMDEPFAGVDPDSRQAMMDILFSKSMSGRIFIICTHHVNEMRDKGAMVRSIENGRLY